MVELNTAMAIYTWNMYANEPKDITNTTLQYVTCATPMQIPSAVTYNWAPQHAGQYTTITIT